MEAIQLTLGTLASKRLMVVFSNGCNADIHMLVKIESADSIVNLPSILVASDRVTKCGWDLSNRRLD
ncbi:hypothetical protein M8C21_000816 [Ambrosia artemisiifolia]|uniref:Uncharacterized protein n=1 Tax=Ambrosia artemisiifolia TaxID=4212 RepID=A0AAD5D7L6_AMBAR|nr:hypothetical protein M8C21_000816 [Ambrosia artemisiifolia]